MRNSYNVKVWKIQTRYKTNDKGKRVPARYVVRWSVERERFETSYRNLAQADSFRSELLAAARRGEPFDTETGRPVSHARKAPRTAWFDFACDYADMKWGTSSPKYRSSIADSLTAITLAMLRETKGMPSIASLSPILRRAFNKRLRDGELSGEQRGLLQFTARNTRPVADLEKPETLRAVLAELEKNKDGKRAAHDTVRLRRITFGSAMDYAVELKLVSANPLKEAKMRKQGSALKQVDFRSVVNPIQARSLLLAVRQTAPRLYAFFALLYFAAMRPEEAANVRKQNLSLPEKGWGQIHIEKAAPEIGKAWTDTGKRGEERGLKHRRDDEGRPVPCSDELTEILHWHLETYGTSPDGRLFWGERSGGPLCATVYARAWKRARERTFTPEIAATPLAQRPYDLRHAAVSTWLNATGDPTRVAEWAGHSVSVLLRVYAKCLDGGDRQAREQVAQRLRGW